MEFLGREGRAGEQWEAEATQTWILPSGSSPPRRGTPRDSQAEYRECSDKGPERTRAPRALTHTAGIKGALWQKRIYTSLEEWVRLGYVKM